MSVRNRMKTMVENRTIINQAKLNLLNEIIFDQRAVEHLPSQFLKPGYFENYHESIEINELWLSFVLPGFSGLQGINWANIFCHAQLIWTTPGSSKRPLIDEKHVITYGDIITKKLYNPPSNELEEEQKTVIKNNISETMSFCFKYFNEVDEKKLILRRNANEANEGSYSAPKHDTTSMFNTTVIEDLKNNVREKQLAFNSLNGVSNNFIRMPDMNKTPDENIRRAPDPNVIIQYNIFFEKLHHEIKEVEKSCSLKKQCSDDDGSLGAPSNCNMIGGSTRKQKRTKKNKKTKKQRKQRKHQKKSKRSRRSHARRSHRKKR